MDKVLLWQNVLAEIEISVTRGTFQAFFKETSLEDLKDSVATIACPSAYLRSLMENRYYSLLKACLDRQTKGNCSLVFVVAPKKEPSTKDLGPLFAEERPGDDAIKRARLRPDFTFENFAVSSSNQVAYAASESVVKSPGTSYNPLFLYGGVGVGKTHLMQAVGNALLKKNSSLKVIYCTGEDFTNEIIEAIRAKNTQKFKGRYRTAQVLLLDDIQFIAGKERVQEEFFHTFNALHRDGAQIVLTSDRPPQEIARLEARLRSRFEGGLTIDIQQPDFELRAAIVLIKAQALGLQLPTDMAQLIAANIEDARRLEGFLKRILTESEIKKIPVTTELITRLLGAKEGDKNIARRVSFKEVMEVVASFYNLKMGDIKGQKRNRPIAQPRQILMYLLRTDLNLTLDEIGELLGGRDHTTIIHGVEKITDLLPSSEKIREDVRQIKTHLYGSAS